MQEIKKRIASPEDQTLIDRILTELQRQSSFSLVRISDGDGLLLGWDDHRKDPDRWLAVRKQLLQWFGRDDFSASELNRMRSVLVVAAERATALATPPLNHTDEKFRWAAQQARRRLSQSQEIRVGGGIHFRLQHNGGLGRIIQAAESITLVTCREGLDRQLSEMTGKPVKWIQVPADTRTDRVAHAKGDTKHIERLPEIRRQCYNQDSQLVLVGAGCLGKIYTTDAMRGGAVALDIGSVMDGWAGIASRSSFKGHLENWSLSACLGETPAGE